jgi:general secretion pathway protein G
MRRRRTERRILFPWERRGGLRRLLGSGRFKPIATAILLAGLVLFIGARERHRTRVRQTRAALLDVRGAVDAYLADHDGGCPPNLNAVASYAAFEHAPSDAWNQPFRLICPAASQDLAYELMSDGPDGNPGGLDRIQ